MAQTAVLGLGVKPSPVPEPHSFQNPTSGIRMNDSRAAPICPKTQNRAGRDAKRNRERLTVLMADLGAQAQGCVRIVLQFLRRLQSKMADSTMKMCVL